MSEREVCAAICPSLLLCMPRVKVRRPTQVRSLDFLGRNGRVPVLCGKNRVCRPWRLIQGPLFSRRLVGDQHFHGVEMHAAVIVFCLVFVSLFRSNEGFVCGLGGCDCWIRRC